MRSIKYSDLLKSACERAQRSYDQISTDDAAFLENFIDSRMKRIWEYCDWPDLVRLEKRTYRQQYSSTAFPSGVAAGTEVYDGNAKRYVVALKATTNEPSDSAEVIHADYAELNTSYAFDDYSSPTTYAIGSQVYYYVTDKYYQSHTAISTGVAPTNTSFWREVPQFDAYVAYEQSWETNKIGNVIGVYNRNPYIHGTSDNINFTLSNNGIQVLNGPDRVFVQYRQQVPDLKYDAHDSTKSDYAVGEVVKHPASGAAFQLYECATASTGNTPGAHADWSLIEIPYIFKDYIASGAAADMLQLDEKVNLALIEENRADRALEHELDKLNRQQKQTEQFNVLTRTN